MKWGGDNTQNTRSSGGAESSTSCTPPAPHARCHNRCSAHRTLTAASCFALAIAEAEEDSYIARDTFVHAPRYRRPVVMTTRDIGGWVRALSSASERTTSPRRDHDIRRGQPVHDAFTGTSGRACALRMCRRDAFQDPLRLRCSVGRTIKRDGPPVATGIQTIPCTATTRTRGWRHFMGAGHVPDEWLPDPGQTGGIRE